MPDGSARMRILLLNNDQECSDVNMVYASTMMNLYKTVYAEIFNKVLPNKMAYAKKYESLTVRKQFHPVLLYDKDILAFHPEWVQDNQALLDSLDKHRTILGVDVVVTDDRIPKSGMYTIDKRNLEKWGVEYSSESLIDELFFSRFIALGVIPTEEYD